MAPVTDIIELLRAWGYDLTQRSTHWDKCWDVHPACALVQMIDLCFADAELTLRDHLAEVDPAIAGQLSEMLAALKHRPRTIRNWEVRR